MPWFSPNPNYYWDKSHGYNELFAHQVRLLRQWFKLQKHTPGVEVSTGFWRKYQFKSHIPNSIIYANVSKMTWMNMSNGKVFFTLDFSLSRSPTGNKPFMENTMEILFPQDFPERMPLVRLTQGRYLDLRSTVSHDHHNFTGGWMCLTDGEYSAQSDSLITVINWAIEWCVLHLDTWGW